MTVATTTSRADYTGNGATVAFTVPFYFLDQTHLTVLRTQISTGVTTTLALTTDYTVSGAGNPLGGTVTCLVAPTSDQRISILRNVPLTQLTDYVENDPFPANSHEQALDKLTMEVQQVSEAIGRALTLSPATVGVSASLPTPASNRLIGWDTNGTALQNVDPSSLLTIAGSSGFAYQFFNGTGAQTAFTLSDNPGSLSNLEVYISGVRQSPVDDYTVSGTTLTILAAPAAGTNNILVRWGQTLGIGVPSDGSVSEAKLADSARSAIRSQQYSAGTTAGSSTAYTLSVTPALTSYAANQTFWVTFHAAAGAAPTLQISGLASPPNLVKQDSTGAYVNIAAGDFPANHRSRVTLLSATQALVEELPPSVNAALGGYGVGTTSPGEFFEVSKSQNANTVMRVVNATATGAAQAVVAAVGGSVTARMVSSPAAGISIVGTQSNHPLVFATNDAERARIDTSGNFYLNSGYGSAGIAYGCRAWVNFNGTGTVAIRASGNVSSITDNGVGDYTVNFTNAMPDANYATVLTTGNSPAGATNLNIRDASAAPTASTVRIFNNWNGTAFDQSILTAAIFR